MVSLNHNGDQEILNYLACDFKTAVVIAGVDPSGLDRVGTGGGDPCGGNPVGADPAGFDPGGFDPSEVDPGGVVPNGIHLGDGNLKAGIAQLLETDLLYVD